MIMFGIYNSWHAFKPKTLKGNLKRILIIIAVLFFAFFCYKVYDFLSFSWLGDDCGMDDGPFNAVMIDPIKISESALEFDLSDNGKLIVDNRTDSLSPILTLKENGIVKWTLDTDTRNTKEYANTRIWNIRKVEILNKSEPIRLQFFADWTYGAESGGMEIDRESGENSFCLSW